jgi:hypothetical protein
MQLRLKAGEAEGLGATISRQRLGKNVSAVTDTDETIEDAVFSMRQLLSNGALNTCPRQQMNVQQWRSRWRWSLLRCSGRCYIPRTNWRRQSQEKNKAEAVCLCVCVGARAFVCG